MEIGAWIGNNGAATPEHMARQARCADATGLASIWAADHIVWPLEYDSKYPYGGDKYPADENQPVCEVIATMSWLSALTSPGPDRQPGDRRARTQPLHSGQAAGHHRSLQRRSNHSRGRHGVDAGGVRHPPDTLRPPLPRAGEHRADADDVARDIPPHSTGSSGAARRSASCPIRYSRRSRCGWGATPSRRSAVRGGSPMDGAPTASARRISAGDGTPSGVPPRVPVGIRPRCTCGLWTPIVLFRLRRPRHPRGPSTGHGRPAGRTDRRVRQGGSPTPHHVQPLPARRPPSTRSPRSPSR